MLNILMASIKYKKGSRIERVLVLVLLQRAAIQLKQRRPMRPPLTDPDRHMGTVSTRLKPRQSSTSSQFTTIFKPPQTHSIHHYTQLHDTAYLEHYTLSKMPSLTATYASPTTSHTFTSELLALSSSPTTSERVAYLDTLSSSLKTLQKDVNEFLTQKMADDKAADDAKDEETYGEEVVDED